MKGLTLLTALAVVAPIASAAAQNGPSISGPSISGWAAPGPSYSEPPPAPLWNNPDRSAIDDDDDDDMPPLPSSRPPAPPYYPPQAMNPPPSPYMNDPVRLRPIDPPPPAYNDQQMPPGWRPGYPNNQLGMGQPMPPHRDYQQREFPPGPPPTTFQNPSVEAPGAVTAMRGGDRSENAMQTLLDQGYSRINPVQPDGRGFVTHAERDGVEMRLWVNPDTGEISRLPD